MKVFLSWSGERSRLLAEALHRWLADVVSFFEPWISSEDIERGARWASDLSQQLEDTDIGILCVTPENRQEPWILFEAGALAKALDRARVCTYLFDLQPSELSGPLVQFQSTRVTKADTFRLLRTLNAQLGEQSLDSKRLDRVFEQWWPELEKDIRVIPGSPGAPRTERSQREMLEELLDLMREQAKTSGTDKAAAIKPFLARKRPFDDSAVWNLFEKVKKAGTLGRHDDSNAEDWGDSAAPEAHQAGLDGVWSSRWYAGQSDVWHTGTATIASHGEYVMLLHTDPRFEYLMLMTWRDDDHLAGRHYNLAEPRDTSPWVGVRVSDTRIDGIWANGRWDLRRSDIK